MDITTARVKARCLMDESHVGLRVWKLKISNSKSWYGMCSERTRTIHISKGHIELGTWAQVKDTVLHEIAHALVGNMHGHDIFWQDKARELGATPSPYGSAPMPKGKWKLHCIECDTTIRQSVHRRCRRHEGARHSNCSKHPNKKFGGTLQYQRAIRPDETALRVDTMTDAMDD